MAVCSRFSLGSPLHFATERFQEYKNKTGNIYAMSRKERVKNFRIYEELYSNDNNEMSTRLKGSENSVNS